MILLGEKKSKFQTIKECAFVVFHTHILFFSARVLGESVKEWNKFYKEKY